MTAPEADYYTLRTEWLRFRSQLFDGLTGLPALPAVIEDVRRLLEARGSVNVVYVDLGRSGWRETILGWAAYDGTVREFADRVGQFREAGVLGPEDLVCLHTVRSDRFLFFHAPESADPEAGVRHQASLLAALGEGPADGGGPGFEGATRPAVGRAHIRQDPMIRSERSIQQAVAEAVASSLMEREEKDESRRAELGRMIDSSAIRSVFHPVVSLGDGQVMGHEALTRPTVRCGFVSVEELFAFAESTEMLVDFERLCRATAIRSVAQVESPGLLFLNCSAPAVEDSEWGDGGVEGQLASSGLAPRDVVVEITERVAVDDRDSFRAALRLLKERGYRVAIDDMGAGHASLQTLAEIEPDFLKFDASLVRDIDKSSIKQSLLESLRSLAEKIRARVIAEGVEREEERQTLVALGIELGQGFLFYREGEVVDGGS